MTDIVIAKYLEDTNWLSRLTTGYNRIVYSKNENEPIGIHRKNMLPNIGRESHTYLHHIINNYDNLTDYTVFVQGDPYPHCPNITEILNDMELNGTYKLCDFNFMALGKGWIAEDDDHGFPNHPNLPLFKYAMHIGIGRTHYRFVPGANFIVSRRAIRFMQKSYYEQLIQLHLSENLMPWIMERCWSDIFNFQ